MEIFFVSNYFHSVCKQVIVRLNNILLSGKQTSPTHLRVS